MKKTGTEESELEDYKKHVQSAFQRIYDLLKEKYGGHLTSEELLEKERAKKPHCGVGNVFHAPPNSGDESGEFTSKEKAKNLKRAKNRV